MNIEKLKREYEKKRPKIKERLNCFRKARNHKELFYEMCYCIMTANGSAKAGLVAQNLLEKNDFLNTGLIGECVKGIRYCENKKKYLLNNRKNILSDNLDLTKYLSGDAFILREKIAKNSRYFKGLGWKESSHFLRNIGFFGLVILDRHIMKNLKELKVIENIPKSLTKRKYVEIEEKTRRFCKNINIPVDEFDLVIWANESNTNICEAK